MRVLCRTTTCVLLYHIGRNLLREISFIEAWKNSNAVSYCSLIHSSLNTIIMHVICNKMIKVWSWRRASRKSINWTKDDQDNGCHNITHIFIEVCLVFNDFEKEISNKTLVHRISRDFQHLTAQAGNVENAIIRSPRYTGDDFMFLYRFGHRRRCHTSQSLFMQQLPNKFSDVFHFW